MRPAHILASTLLVYSTVMDSRLSTSFQCSSFSPSLVYTMFAH
jgi:hypothetical protein